MASPPAVSAPYPGRPASRKPRINRPLILAILVLGGIAAIAAAGTPLRETWLNLQSVDTLTGMNARSDADSLTRFVYAERLAQLDRKAEALPVARAAAASVQTSTPRELAGRIRCLAGRLEAESGNLQDAESDLSAASPLRQADPMLYLGLGILAQRRHHLLEAERALQRAAELDPGQVEVWRRLGAVCLQLDDTDWALSAYQRAADLAPRNPQSHADLSEALARKGDNAAAFRECNAAARLAPDTESYACLPAVSRATSARTEQDYAGAAEMLGAAADRYRNVAFLRALLSGLHARFNHYEPARRELTLYLAASPRDANGWLNMQTICERLADRRGESAARSRYLWLTAREEEAVSLRQQLLLHPDSIDLLVKLGTALERSGRTSEAVKTFSRALELQPGDTAIFQRIQQAQSALSEGGELMQTGQIEGQPH